MIPSSKAAPGTDRLWPDRMPSSLPARSLSSSCPSLSGRFRPGHAGSALASPAQSDLPAKKERAQWKYSDCHFHPTNYIQQGYKPANLIAEMDALGIHYATLMPIPTNVLSSQPDPAWKPCAGEQHCGPHYYLPSHLMTKRMLTPRDLDEACAATELYMNTGVDATTAMHYLQLPAAQRHRFDPMITGLHLGDMHSSTYLLQKLAQHPGVFTGVGEITVHKEVVQDLFAGKRQANLENNAEALIKLLQTCGIIGMPVVLHCDIDLPGKEANAAPAYLEGIKRLFCHPDVSDTSIIWAHGGGLGRFVNAPEGHTAALRELLEDQGLKHVHIDLSWSVVAERLTQSAQTQAEWAALITDHPGRFLFGSDALAPTDRDAWNKTYASYEGLLKCLPDTVRLQILRGNYKRLFVDARQKVRRYEMFFLASALHESRRTPGAGLTSSLSTGAASTSTSASAMGVRDSRADTVDEACTTPREEQFILSAQPHGSPGALRQ
jgi:hypothetical protein